MRSQWAREIPGLDDEIRNWIKFAPGHRAYLERRALAFATPALNPQGLKHLAETGGRALGAAAVWATADQARAAYRAVVYGEREDVRLRDATKRAEGVVRAGGSAYVKFGQFLSTARGLLPDEIVDSFAWCRDEAEPLSSQVVRDSFETAVRRRMQGIFRDFDDRPAAAASIAQVHRARLLDGREVAVKVRRPGLHQQFEGSLRAMALMAAVAERMSFAARVANASGFVELFSQLVLEELDFRLEALNMAEAGLAVEDARVNDFVRCARPIPGLVTENVLVMEWLPGVRYTDAAAMLDANVDRRRLLRLAIQTIVEHTLIYGRFHGDLHAGNVLVTPEGNFSLVDFGIMGRLDAPQRAAVVRLLAGFATHDIEAQLLAMVELGAIPPEADLVALRTAFEDEERRMGSRPGGLTYDSMADELGRAIRILVASGFRLPKTLVLFFKNILYLNGFAAAVAPGSDLLAEIEPILNYFQGKYADQIGMHGVKISGKSWKQPGVTG